MTDVGRHTETVEAAFEFLYCLTPRGRQHFLAVLRHPTVQRSIGSVAMSFEDAGKVFEDHV